MATTFVDYTGDGNATKSFSFPSYKVEDIKVKVDDVLQTVGTHYNITSYTTTGGGNVVFIDNSGSGGTNYIPADPADVHIYRDTDVDSAKATYTAGSSVKAGDLNNNHTQLLNALQEEQNQPVRVGNITDSAVTTAKIKDNNVTLAKLGSGPLPTDITVASANLVDGTIVNADVNASAAIAGTKVAPDFGSQVVTTTGNIVVGGTVDGRDVAADGTKLDGIEASATADQTAAEIRTLVESASDSNVFTNTDHSRLNAIEDNATADQTDAEIRAAVEAASDSNVFTDADHSKLNAIEASATADQTASEIKTLLQSDKLELSEMNTTSLDTRYYTETEAEALFLRQDSSETIASGVSWSNADDKVATTAAINARIIDLVDDIGGFTVLANETSFPNTNPQGGTGQAAIMSIGALSQAYTPSGTTVTIANGTVGNSTVTITGVPSVLPIGFGILVESTSTLNEYTFHRLVPKATEVTTVAGSITNINACGNNLTNIENFADLYQISTSAPTTRADGTALTTGDLWFDSSSNQVMMVYDGSSGDGFSPITPDQSTITAINSVSGYVTFQEDLGLITNAVNTGSGNNSINTCGANIASINTVAADLNEATSEIDTVAGAITNINNVGNNIANVNAVAGNNSNVTAVANNASNINAAVANASNINATVSNATNINSVATSISDVNNFVDRYQISSSAPTQRSDGTSLQNGDLWFNNTSVAMESYDGSAGDGYTPIQPSATVIQNIANVTGFVTFVEDNGLITDAVNTGTGNNSINAVGADITNVNTTAGSITNVNTVAGSIANVNTTAGSITNVNTVAGAIADVNRYANEYVISSSAPSSPSQGDLWFSTTSNVLNYYTGSSWTNISPGIAGLVNDSAPNLAGNLDANNYNFTEVGTISGNNLQLDFGTL